MGTFNKGINGEFHGKVGSVIGSKWKSIPYIKGLPRVKKHRKSSEDQLKQQEKFKLLLQFFAPLKRYLAIGFQQFMDRQTAVNAAMRFNFDEALSETEHGIQLEYSKIQLSQGSLFTPGNEKGTWVDEGLEISWNTKTYGIRGDFDDQVYVVCFCEESDIPFISKKATRGDGKLLLSKIPKKGMIMEHAWLFLSDALGKQVSRTIYIPIPTKED